MKRNKSACAAVIIFGLSAANANAETLGYTFDLSNNNAAGTLVFKEVNVGPAYLDSFSVYAKIPNFTQFNAIQYGASSELTINDDIKVILGIDGVHTDEKNALSGFGEISAKHGSFGEVKIKGEFPQNKFTLNYKTPAIEWLGVNTFNATVAANLEKNKNPDTQIGFDVGFGEIFKLTGLIEPNISNFKESAFALKFEGSYKFPD